MEALKGRITVDPLRSIDPLINAALHVDLMVSTTDSQFERSHKEAVLDMKSVVYNQTHLYQLTVCICRAVKYRHTAGSLRAAGKSVIFSCKPRK